jgi:hypothetical protein
MKDLLSITSRLLVIGLTSLLLSTNSYSQDVSCNELLNIIKTEGYYKTSLSSYTLNSSWLSEVTAYTYDSQVYVITKIRGNTYIYCGVPNQNWSNFQYGSYGDSQSYGKRFHKYIINYKCDCY